MLLSKTRKCYTSPIFNIVSYQIHTSYVRIALPNTFKKVVHKEGIKKKLKYHENNSPLPSVVSNFSKGANEGKQSSSFKRVIVLNKLFWRYIGDLINTGECSKLFQELDIEINRIQVTKDFKTVNLYWIKKDSFKNEDIEKTLIKLSCLLRNELTQLHILGRVPKLQFVQDKHLEKISEVERLLKIADFGDEYEPAKDKQSLRSPLQLNTRLDPQVARQISELENGEEVIEYNEVLPEMTCNVFGLDRNYILNYLKKMSGTSKEKVKNPKITQEELCKNTDTDFKTNTEQREAFKEFLIKRQILKNQSRKKRKEDELKCDFSQDELVDTSSHFENENFKTFEENYLDEDDEVEFSTKYKNVK